MRGTVNSCGVPIPHDGGLCAAPVRDQPAQVDRRASRCAGMDGTGQLTVRTARDGDRVLVEIGDNGPGILEAAARAPAQLVCAWTISPISSNVTPSRASPCR